MTDRPPWRHQEISAARTRDMRWFAFFWEMGCGKTRGVIDALRNKINSEKRLLRTLIFCPPIVVPNWPDEVGMYSKIPTDKVIPLQGSAVKRLETFRQHAYDEQGKATGALFVTNYESLSMGSRLEGKVRKKVIPGPLFEAFQKWRPEALIYDESHQLKNYKAIRSKLAEKLATPAHAFVPRLGLDPLLDQSLRPYVYLLSGTPVLNSPMDLFHQFLLMDGGVTFTRNPRIFLARYFYDKNAGMPKDRYFPDWQLQPGAEEKISQAIASAGMRVTKDECMDLPEEVAVTIKCGMTAQQARNYKEMRQDYVTYVRENAATASLAIVKALRLMQITSGFLPLNPTGDEMDQAKEVYKDTPKDEALRDLLETITPTSKVLVWAVWKENYGKIREVFEALGLETVEVHGGISRARQDENVRRFKTDPKIRGFIGHPGSGGIGINLIGDPGTSNRCAYSVFYSRNFSLAQWLQARARNHRGGQQDKVTHYDLVVEKTIDALAQIKLAAKLDMSEKLLKDISLEVMNQ